MRSRLWLNLGTGIILLALLLAMPLLSACGGNKEPATTTPATTPAASSTPSATTPVAVKSELDVVKAAVADYLTHMAPNIKAADLQMMIAEGDAPYIVSLRSAEDYAKGHIPGAVNMKFSDLATLPKDKDIVVYCYTGQSASFAAATLGIQGYNVSNLRDGMSSWSNDPDVYVRRFDPATQGNYSVETTSNAGGSYALPVLDNTASDDPAEIVKAAAATVTPQYITATDLNMKIAEGEEMTIVSVRKADAYAAGHIPGAINIQISDLVNELDKINPDAPVYVYCYTGHSAAQTTALLQMLGYDAYSLAYGMCSWSSDPDVNLGVCFDPSTVQGYATEK
jgi:rhodanese-related sulfurtransferase